MNASYAFSGSSFEPRNNIVFSSRFVIGRTSQTKLLILGNRVGFCWSECWLEPTVIANLEFWLDFLQRPDAGDCGNGMTMFRANNMDLVCVTPE